MIQLEQTLFAIAALLDRRGVEYAVMGGLAVRMHSIPRPTYDVDLTIAIDREDLSSLFDSLEELGLTVPESYHHGWSSRNRFSESFDSEANESENRRRLEITDRLEAALAER